MLYATTTIFQKVILEHPVLLIYGFSKIHIFLFTLTMNELFFIYICFITTHLQLFQTIFKFKI